MGLRELIGAPISRDEVGRGKRGGKHEKGQPPRYTASHGIRNKERCTEIEKDTKIEKTQRQKSERLI